MCLLCHVVSTATLWHTCSRNGSGSVSHFALHSTGSVPQFSPFQAPYSGFEKASLVYSKAPIIMYIQPSSYVNEADTHQLVL